jgi:hypothetical protein
MRRQRRPLLRGGDTRGAAVARHFTSEALPGICQRLDIDPDSTMHLEYTLVGDESPDEICGLAATAIALRMTVGVYMMIRTCSKLDVHTKDGVKQKVVFIQNDE